MNSVLSVILLGSLITKEKPRTIPLELHDTVNAPILQKKTQLVNMQSPPLVLSNLSPYRQDYGLASGNSMSRLTNLISLPRGQIYNGMKGAIQETHGIDPRQTLPIGFGYQESAGAVILPARRNRASSYYISPRNDARIRRGPHMVTSSSPARSMSLIPDSSVDPFAPEIRNLRLSQTGTPRLPHTQPLGLSQIRAPGLSNNNVNLMHSPRQTAQRTSSRLGPRAPRHFWNGRRMFPAQGRSPVWATSGGQVRDISAYLKKFGYLNDNVPGQPYNTYEMRRAIRAFQTMSGLPDTGELNIETIRKMGQPRCGNPDVIITRAPGAPLAYTVPGGKWNRNQLTYAFSGFSRQLTQRTVRAIIREAFGLWARQTPLQFSELSQGSRADIMIDFVRNEHGDGQPFDGRGPDGRLYIFRGDMAYRFNSNGVGIENGYPRPISEVLGNGPSWIEAAVSDGRTGKFYIFKDGQYWRYTGFRLDAGYPRRLRGWYIGVQAALYDYGWIILLKGNELSIWREDFDTPPRDFPRAAQSVWPGLPSNPDGAVRVQGGNYFFKGLEHHYNSLETARAEQMIEDGLSQCRVARYLCVSPSVVNRLWAHYLEPGNYIRRPGQVLGYPKEASDLWRFYCSRLDGLLKG